MRYGSKRPRRILLCRVGADVSSRFVIIELLEVVQWASCQIRKIVRDARAVMHAGIANQRFLLKSVAGKRSRHSWCMRNAQFYVSGKMRKEKILYDLFSHLVECLFSSHYGQTIWSRTKWPPFCRYPLQMHSLE